MCSDVYVCICMKADKHDSQSACLYQSSVMNESPCMLVCTYVARDIRVYACVFAYRYVEMSP